MARVIAYAIACLAAVLAPGGCGSPPPPRGPTEAELRLFSEAEAHHIIGEVMEEHAVPVQMAWPVRLGADAPFEVDVRLGQSHFGVEWVSPQDRQAHGDRIPRPDPDGQLRIMPGSGEDAQAQILVLEHSNYRYDPDLHRVQRGSTGPAEAEARLRRDLTDYLEYVRGQGGL